MKICCGELSTAEGKALCKCFLDSVQKRLNPYESRSVSQLSTMLDPRFKKEGFQNSQNSENAALLLEREMALVLAKKKENEPPQQPSQAEANTSSLFNFLKGRVELKSKLTSVDVIITKRQYLHRMNSTQDTDPLLFWKVSFF